MKLQKQSYESMLLSEHIRCPYCGEHQWIDIDCSIQEDDYYQDCQVCCQSIHVTMRANNIGQLLELQTKRDDE